MFSYLTDQITSKNHNIPNNKVQDSLNSLFGDDWNSTVRTHSVGVNLFWNQGQNDTSALADKFSSEEQYAPAFRSGEFWGDYALPSGPLLDSLV